MLTFVSKWRQEQLKQKIIEEEREYDKGPPQLKLYSNNSKLNLFSGQSASTDSQSILLSLKNLKRSTSSSAGSIFSLNGEYCFKQEKIGRLFISVDTYCKYKHIFNVDLCSYTCSCWKICRILEGRIYWSIALWI